MKHVSYDKTVHVTWSGGIDSTAVIGHLLKAGWAVHPVTLLFGGHLYRSREAAARSKLLEVMRQQYPGLLFSSSLEGATWLWNFSADGIEIPRRNKHILDFLMMHFVIPANGYYVGMGEYIGTDSWAVKDHVGARDADTRYLSAYLLAEYGYTYQLITLDNFGFARYKSDRVRLLIDAIGEEAAFMTTNCMADLEMHCGKCYKCIERHVAFQRVLGCDDTVYKFPPMHTDSYEIYQQQMAGEAVDLKWEDIKDA